MSTSFFLGDYMITDYGQFVSYVLGLLQSFQLLEPMKYFLLFVLSVAAMRVLVRFMTGGGGG